MKKSIRSLAACFLFVGIVYSQENTTENEDTLKIEEIIETVKLNWEPTFKEALKKSRKEKKPILIYFTGSDWCGPCKVLDKKLFHTEKFKSLADKDLILYEADDPRNKDLVTADKLEITYDLKRKYKIRSFPTLVFVNHKGKMIGYKKGLILTEYYYPFIQSVIENY